MIDYEPREFEGERYLYTEDDARESSNALTNDEQWRELQEQLEEILRKRNIEPEPRRFYKSYYRHSGAVILTMRYTLVHHSSHSARS